MIALGLCSLLEFFAGDFILEVDQSLGGLDSGRNDVLIPLADNGVADMLAIAFPDFVVSLERQVACIDNDDDTVFKRRKSAALRQVSARLLELNLAIDRVKYAVPRFGGLQPFRESAFVPTIGWLSWRGTA